jgi:hypothetical protein
VIPRSLRYLIAGVFGELARQPAGCGLRADEDEQGARCQFRRLLRPDVEQLNAFELIFPDQGGAMGLGSAQAASSGCRQAR